MSEITLPPGELPKLPGDVIVICQCGCEWNPLNEDRCPDCNLSPEHGPN